MKSQKVWSAKDAARCIVTPSDLDHKYSRGVLGIITGIIGALVATNYIEILNSKERLAHVAATGALIHNQAALLASQGSPIIASAISSNIQEAIRKLLK